MPLSRIDTARGAVEEGAKGPGYGLDSLNGRERKLTRNLKRKHDEINHVQKVKYACKGMVRFHNGRPMPVHGGNEYLF